METSFSQGLLLCILSSCLCLLGCLVIYLDDLYVLIVPKFITKRYPFELKENYGFLIASLGFSSGSLLFTSLYRLLPHAYSYLDDSTVGTKKVNASLFLWFTSGTVLSLGLNEILHLITSESVVHCNHGGDLEHGADHDHSHSHSHSHSQYQGTSDLSHDHEPDNYDDEHSHDQVLYGNRDHQHEHQHSSQQLHEHQHDHTHLTRINEEDLDFNESTPLFNTVKKKFSLIHIFKETPYGECKGYSSAEMCLNDNKGLHYCELPTLTKSNTSLQEIHTNYSGHNEYSPAPHNDNPHVLSSKSIHTVDTVDTDHHHHITTPISRLLMIGIQTTLAITLHKLPEGFVTYVTSEANSTLGIEIFLSLLVHNFIEGFSMCLPLYYSFVDSDSKQLAKFKALLISGGLGAIAQPLGAMFGYFFLQYNPISNHDNLESLNYVFGVSMAITSGFLTVIGLTMFSSAVAFNNRSPNSVVVWALIGIAVIGASSILSSESD